MPTMYPHCVLGIDGYLADFKTDIGFVRGSNFDFVCTALLTQYFTK